MSVIQLSGLQATRLPNGTVSPFHRQISRFARETEGAIVKLVFLGWAAWFDLASLMNLLLVFWSRTTQRFGGFGTPIRAQDFARADCSPPVFRAASPSRLQRIKIK